MRYKFIAVYQLIGVSRPVDAKEEVLAQFPSMEARALLAYDLDGHLFEFDRELAARIWNLKKIFNNAGKGRFEEEVTDEMEKLRDSRKNNTNNGVFAIFEADGEIESFNRRNEKELSEFIIAIEGADKEPIRDQYQTPINGLLTSLTLGLEQISAIKLMTDGVVFFNDKNKPVYSLNMNSSAKMTVSTPLVATDLDFVRKNTRTLSKHQNLVNSSHLLIKSMDEKSDELLSFLSVWAGLEIFVNKNFRAYETSLFEKMKIGEKTSVPLRFLERIKGVMKDKYRLLDKFTIICFELSPDSVDEDIIKFDSINQNRNKLFHAGKVDISSLPTENTQKLLRKYLKLHMTQIRE